MSDGKQSPVDRLQHIRRQCRINDRKYTHRKYLGAQKIAINEIELRNDVNEWERFCNLPDWRKKPGNPPKQDDPSTALHHSFVFAYIDITDGRDMASLHCRAVKALLVKGVERKNIAEELKKGGGFTGALKPVARQDGNGAERTGRTTNEKAGRDPDVRKLAVNPGTQLLIDLPKSKAAKICGLKKGESFWVECRHVGVNDDGLITFKAVGYHDL